jgi:hypothetical protein
MTFWYWAIRACWGVVRGRWYVWRDAPDDVVRQVASLWRGVRHDKDEDLRGVIAQARAEHRLRTAMRVKP